MGAFFAGNELMEMLIILKSRFNIYLISITDYNFTKITYFKALCLPLILFQFLQSMADYFLGFRVKNALFHFPS